MPNLKKGADCCGCTACASICPKDAITMVPDALGFKYPEVNMDLCVECGACERVCDFKPDYPTPNNFENPIPKGVRMKDKAQLMKSRSGGAFAAFSDWILEQGGVIYGAGFKDHFVVAHCRATTKEERDAMRGSKYVQSNLDGIFRQVKKDLQDGKWVLFSGTGCQTSGLQSYLPKKLQEKLIVVDIVCHGVPSPRIWAEYLASIEKKYGKKAVGVNFRDKKMFGWRDHKETITFEDGSSISDDAYTYIFYQHIMLRDSCANCYFCNLRRASDLTLADFWGWEKTNPTFNADNKGASLVLINTPKGKTLFDAVSSQFDMISPKLEDCMQAHLKHPTTLSPLHEQFAKDYEEHGYNYVFKKYGNKNLRYKLKNLRMETIIKAKKLLGLYKE